MVLLGHLHTHEFAVGGTTDQVGNPWALERSAGGSSGGSAAALAARMVPAATGTDTAGSLRIPSALCGTSTIKPTRGLVSLRGVVPLADEPRPRRADGAHARGLRAAPGGDGRARSGPPRSALAAAPPARLPAPRAGAKPLAGVRLALSPRVDRSALDADVADGLDAALAHCSALGAVLVAPPAAGRRARRRRRLPRRPLRRAARLPPPLRRPPRALPPVAARVGRAGGGARRLGRALPRRAGAPPRDDRAALAWWLADYRISALLEPTVPCVAPAARRRLRPRGSDYALISLTHYWDWTGFPVVGAAGGRRRAQRPPGRRLADRPARGRLGPARHRHPAPGRARRARPRRASRRPPREFPRSRDGRGARSGDTFHTTEGSRR